ncbi:hypothetical protein ACLOJK_004151 [Asimina triloba]
MLGFRWVLIGDDGRTLLPNCHWKRRSPDLSITYSATRSEEETARSRSRGADAAENAIWGCLLLDDVSPSRPCCYRPPISPT